MASESSPTSSRRRVDIATVVGIVVGIGGILGGLLLEGGKFTDIVQYTAALIVGAGTAGAVLVTTPSPLIRAALRRLRDVFFETTTPRAALTSQLLRFARQARRSGIVSLEETAEGISDNPFLKKALLLAVDGADLQDLRRIMELEIETAARRGESEAKVFETAGGYAPTIGIIGAVLGLIQVMKHLEDIERVGHGIAVAFVATVYGVALANLILLPAGAKIKARLERSLEDMELVLEGVIGIAEGMNPKLLETKLGAFLEEDFTGTAIEDAALANPHAPEHVIAPGHGAI
jgi:chemotaxis protein MotA